MKFEIGRPAHGWVTVRIKIGGDWFEFDASDVPNDPVACLIQAISDCAQGREACVWWHLEPAGVYFEFDPDELGTTLQILFEPSSNRAKASVRAVVSGSRSRILMPLWRGLRRFVGYRACEPHWPALDKGAVTALRALI